MADYKEGIKKEVAEIKFLIHDLRVERFINDIIHFHVTLDTDLEIYSIDQAQAMHGEDLQVLKAQAANLRKAFQDYSNAVKNFSPDRTILLTGRKYIDTILTICELILNPLWGRADRVLDFLPRDSRSAHSRLQYRNCVDWISGVRRRIQYFLKEQEGKEVLEEFDIAVEIGEVTRNVIQGYVTEKSAARVELQLGQLDSAILYGNVPRFRRMYFNLIMNAVDALSDQRVGILRITDRIEGDRVVFQVRDDGSGMTQEKKQTLLTDKETLDGELHSLGFVFVRQTIAEFQGELSIDSALGKGTTITVRFPYRPGATAPRRSLASREDYGRPHSSGADSGRTASGTSPAPSGAAPADGVDGGGDVDGSKPYGSMVFQAYQASRAPFPGSIFAIAVTEDDEVDCFTYRAYERNWNLTHEDLTPMLFQSTIRGRVEEDDQKAPVLILKPPQSVTDYFEFKEVPQSERSAAKHVQMVHDECIRVARKLIATGMPSQIGMLLADAQRYFPEKQELQAEVPFPLEILASQSLASEQEP